MASKSARFFSASLAGSLLSIVRLGAGLIRVKYVAIVLGTAGVGLLSQGNQLGLLGITIGSLSMAVGIISRLTAKGEPETKRRMLSTAFTTQLSLSLLILIITLTMPNFVSTTVFGTPHEALKCIAVMLGIPFAVLASGYMEGILFGSDRYDLYVKATMVSTILGLLAMLPLVHRWGLDGAFWALTANSVLLFLSFLFFTTRIRRLREIFVIGFHFKEFKSLLKYSFVILCTSGLGYLATLLVRRQILSALGPSENGIAQVPLALSAYYAPFLTNALWGRLHPTVAKSGDCADARHEFSIALRYTVLFGAGIMASILLVQEHLIRIVYSRDFLGANTLLPIQFAGDAFHFVAFTFGVYYLGVGKLRVYVAGWAIYNLGVALLSILLLPKLGLKAMPTAHLITSALIASIACIHWLTKFSRNTEFRITLAIVVGCILVVATEAILVLDHVAIGWRAIAPTLFIASLVVRRLQSSSR